MRHTLGLAVVFGGLLLAAGAAGADQPKKTHFTPGYNDPTIGVLGAHKGQSEAAGGTIKPNAVPPAPVAAGPLPKVEAEQPVESGLPTTSPSMAVPRPEARVDGATIGGMAAPAQPQQVNTFLASHPVISGLVAGLIGTDLGSMLYGGPMMGDQTAASIGFIVRVGLVLLVALLVVRLAWGIIGGSGDDDFGPSDRRREPSLGRRGEAGGGRREPTLGRDRDDDYDEPSLAPRRETRSNLSARRR